jgi:hypothetical protein
MVKTINILLLALIFTLSGCSQPTAKPNEINLVGNFFLAKPDNKIDKGYIFICREPEYDKNIIYNNYITEISGNDTLLVAECKTNLGVISYYKVIHNAGNLPFSSTQIDLEQYKNLKKELKSKYHYKKD